MFAGRTPRRDRAAAHHVEVVGGDGAACRQRRYRQAAGRARGPSSMRCRPTFAARRSSPNLPATLPLTRTAITGHASVFQPFTSSASRSRGSWCPSGRRRSADAHKAAYAGRVLFPAAKPSRCDCAGALLSSSLHVDQGRDAATPVSTCSTPRVPPGPLRVIDNSGIPRSPRPHPATVPAEGERTNQLDPRGRRSDPMRSRSRSHGRCQTRATKRPPRPQGTGLGTSRSLRLCNRSSCTTAVRDCCRSCASGGACSSEPSDRPLRERVGRGLIAHPADDFTSAGGG